MTAPLVGWLCDRYGPRKVALPGLVGLSLAFFAARVANDALAVRLFNQHMPTETRDHQARLCARDGGP